jgi:beta-xylosidase
MKHKLLPSALCLFTAVAVSAQNPISHEGTFFADPSARQWKDGKVYLYGSRDESASYWCSYSYDILSSADLKSWTVHKNVFSSKGENDEIAGTDALLFAPDISTSLSCFFLLKRLVRTRNTQTNSISAITIGVPPIKTR